MLISADYFTPKEYPNNVLLGIKIEVYLTLYNNGGVSYNMQEGKLTYTEPNYLGELKGMVTYANLSVDSTSDMRTTGSFSIILEENSPYIPDSNGMFYWHDHWLKIIKTYDYPDSEGHDEFVVGWFAPIDGSFMYNAETREFSMSCTDVLSFFTETRGGHLSGYGDVGGSSGIDVPTDKVFSRAMELVKEQSNTENLGVTGDSPYLDKSAKDFVEDLDKVAKYSSGIILEGDRNNTQIDLKRNNYFESIKADEDYKIGFTWRNEYNQFLIDYKNAYYIETSSGEPDEYFNDINSLVDTLVNNYGRLIEYNGVVVDLNGGWNKVPYDLEFDGDTTLFDVLKKLADLYPGNYIYFDTDRRLNIVRESNRQVAFGNEFSNTIIEEHWNIDTSDIKNYTVVWGRNNSCVGYYYISDSPSLCDSCGEEDHRGGSGIPGDSCPYCGNGTVRTTYLPTQNFSVTFIGVHKQVIYDDNILTDQEAFDEARALTYQTCRDKQTLSVTLCDCFYRSLYEENKLNLGVGDIIEYTSSLNGETRLFRLNKWSNDFSVNGSTITLELDSYHSHLDDISSSTLRGTLPIPEFTYTVENGELTMIINNGEFTSECYFKIYYTITGADLTEGQISSEHTTFDFLGESCTSDENGNIIFKHKFNKSGTYLIMCQACSPDKISSPMYNPIAIHISVANEDFIPEHVDSETTLPGTPIITPVITKDNVYISSSGYYFVDVNGKYYTVTQ